MIDHETLRKLRELKLDGMATGFEELLGRALPHDMKLSELRARRHPRRPRVVGPREPEPGRGLKWPGTPAQIPGASGN